MRPANQKQAVQHMEHLLGRKIAGRRKTRVKEHTNRAKRMAAAIWNRFQIGPYQYRLKHLKWYLEAQTRHLTANTAYRHWLTTKNVITALGKEADWMGQLRGPWITPQSTQPENG